MKATWWGAGVLATALLGAPLAVSADDDDDWFERDDRWRRDDRWERDDRYRRDDRFGRSRFGSRAFDAGFERGFREGAKHGRKDGERRRGFDFRHDDDYWDADNGYRSSYGPRHEYASGYRRGYEEGYREAFSTVRGHDRYRSRRYGRDRFDPYRR